MPREVVPYTDTMSSWPRRHIIVMDFNSLCIHLFLATSARHCRGLQQFVCIYISSWPRRASARHCRGLHIHLFLAASGVGTSLLWTSTVHVHIHIFLAASIVVCLVSNNQQTFSRLVFINFLSFSRPIHNTFKFQSCQVVLSNSVADSRPYIRRDDNNGLLRSTPQTHPAAQCIDPPP
jgi:hypothetical protein